ncbi:unnamed protein product [Ascophyllum nodosum]
MRSQRAVWGGEEDNSDGLLHRNAGEDGEGTISFEAAGLVHWYSAVARCCSTSQPQQDYAAAGAFVCKDGSNMQLHQMTSSAVGNIPEKDVEGIKASLLRGVIHADETLFPFKVKHHDWIFGPNYGMVDLYLNKSKRPAISREC